MKSLLLTILAVILCSMASAQIQAPPPSEDNSYQAAISKDPRAERPRYDYSYFLYTKKRFSDAREQLNLLFGINAKHVGGRKLLNSINEVDGLADINYQDQQMRLFMIEKMKLDQEEEEKKANKLAGVLTPDRIALIQTDLDKRYRLSERIALEVLPKDGEEKFQSDFAKSLSANQFSEAEKIARNWVTAFEKSSIAKAEFGAFLILRDRLIQAEVLLRDAAKSDPDSLKLRIVADVLKDLKGVKSSERIADLKSRLKNELAVYQMAAQKQLGEAKRTPSGSPPSPAINTLKPEPPSDAAPSNSPAPKLEEAKVQQSVSNLPPVLTAEDIEKMQISPSEKKIQRRK